MFNVVTEEAKQFNLDESISETNVENIKEKKWVTGQWNKKDSGKMKLAANLIENLLALIVTLVSSEIVAKKLGAKIGHKMRVIRITNSLDRQIWGVGETENFSQTLQLFQILGVYFPNVNLMWETTYSFKCRTQEYFMTCVRRWCYLRPSTSKYLTNMKYEQSSIRKSIKEESLLKTEDLLEIESLVSSFLCMVQIDLLRKILYQPCYGNSIVGYGEKERLCHVN